MVGMLLAFVAGTGFLHLQSQLPGPFWPLAMLLAAAVLLVGFRARAEVWWVAAFVLGFSWAWWHAIGIVEARLPEQWAGQDVVLVGRIADFPQSNGPVTRLLVEVEVPAEEASALRTGDRIRVNDYGDEREYRAGERWRFKLRLKRPRGLANPGSFDYEAWLFRQRVVATGYVREDPSIERLSAGGSFVWLRVRAWLAERIDTATGQDSAHLGVIRALALGDRSRLSSDRWSVFAATGTSHLMAISGLHVGLLSAWVFWLVRLVWMRIPARAQRWPPDRVAAPAALLAATVYAALAGFSVPTQRALVMLAVVLLMIWRQRAVSPWRVFLLALAAVFVFDPLAWLAPGAWLSFAAVALILYGSWGYRHAGGAVRSLLRIQWFIAIGLVPMTLWWFQTISWVAPVVNLIAVPVFSIAVVPLVLVGTVLAAMDPAWGSVPLHWVEVGLEAVWPYWVLLADSSFGVSDWRTPSLGALVLLVVGAFWFLAPRGLPGRWVGLCLAVAALAWPVPRLDDGTVELTLLDVGQGLSAIVRTRDHVLVFDAGPRHASGSDAGRLVVIPYLKSLGVRRVDALVVSHADQDHAGGVAALRAELNVDRVWMGDSDQRRFPAVLPCRAGEVWAWDAVQFKFLHPQPDKTVSAGNEGSCVLSVKAPGGHVLLTGDIGFESERLLLQAPEALDADVLVVPHHGSAGSSSPAFVAAVSPNWALVSAGYGNRYGFPKAEVVDRYQRLGASVDVTGHSGAIRLVLPSNGEPKLENWRESGRRYWHEPDGCHADLAQGSARLQWCGSNAKSSMMPH